MFSLISGMRRFWAMDGRGGPKSDAFMLWIDAVGGYWVCLREVVTLGQPLPQGQADVPILADLSARHARIRRDGEGYLIEALRELHVDGRPVPQLGWLNDGSRIDLGANVRLVFRRPHALSATARLDFASRHRTQPSCDAVLLMADACVLGPKPQSHVVCRAWPHEVILYRQGDELFCRTAGDLTIDGKHYRERGPLRRNSRVEGETFSFSLEAM
jgi:hypothetical protein